MPTTTTSVVVAVSFILVVYVVFEGVSRGIPDDKNSEVEVGLFPPKIRRKVSDPGRVTAGIEAERLRAQESAGRPHPRKMTAATGAPRAGTKADPDGRHGCSEILTNTKQLLLMAD